MQRIDKILVSARREAVKETKRRKQTDLKQAIHSMTTEQLRELVYGFPSDERIADIFNSVGALSLLESG